MLHILIIPILEVIIRQLFLLTLPLFPQFPIQETSGQELLPLPLQQAQMVGAYPFLRRRLPLRVPGMDHDHLWCRNLRRDAGVRGSA